MYNLHTGNPRVLKDFFIRRFYALTVCITSY